MALQAKERGNAAFAARDYITAIQEYTKAIELEGNNHVLYSNRSASFAMIGEWDNAKQDAIVCTKLNSNWSKGWSRLGAAETGLGNHEGALIAYDKALSLDPSNDQLVAGRKRILETIEMQKNCPQYIEMMFNPEKTAEAVAAFKHVVGSKLSQAWSNIVPKRVGTCNDEMLAVLFKDILPYLDHLCSDESIHLNGRTAALEMSVVLCTELMKRFAANMDQFGQEFQTCQYQRILILSKLGRADESIKAAVEAIKKISSSNKPSVWQLYMGLLVKIRMEQVSVLLSSPNFTASQLSSIKTQIHQALSEIKEINENLASNPPPADEKVTLENLHFATHIANEVSVLLQIGNIRDHMRAALGATRASLDIHSKGTSEQWPQVCMRYVTQCIELARKTNDEEEKRRCTEDTIQVCEDLFSMGATASNVYSWKAMALLLHPGGGPTATITESGSRGKKLRAKEAMKIASNLESSGDNYMMKKVDIEIILANACLLLGEAASDEEGKFQGVDRAIQHLRLCMDNAADPKGIPAQELVLKFYIQRNCMNTYTLHGDALMMAAAAESRPTEAIGSFDKALQYSEIHPPFSDLLNHAETLTKLAKCYLWRAVDPSLTYADCMQLINDIALDGTLSTLTLKGSKKDVDAAFCYAATAAKYYKEEWGINESLIDLKWTLAITKALNQQSSIKPVSLLKDLYSVVNICEAETANTWLVQLCALGAMCTYALRGYQNGSNSAALRVEYYNQFSKCVQQAQDGYFGENSALLGSGSVKVKKTAEAVRNLIASHWEQNQTIDPKVVQAYETAQTIKNVSVAAGLASVAALGLVWYLRHRRSNQ